jgi:uncharacterized protein (TIGR00369 family)
MVGGGMGPDASSHAFTARIHAIPLHAWMGLEVARMGPDAVVTMNLDAKLRGYAEGTIHGGLLATLADVTCAFALWGAYDEATEVPVTTDMHVRYYRQPESGPLRAESHLAHHGRRLLSAECSVVDGAGRELVRATATYMILSRPAT